MLKSHLKKERNGEEKHSEHCNCMASQGLDFYIPTLYSLKFIKKRKTMQQRDDVRKLKNVDPLWK